MPLQASLIEEKIAAAFQEERLAHAFLLAGADLDALEELALRMASQLLGVKASLAGQHPDLHWLKPESKSRRILIQQVRELEHEVRLKPLAAPCKIAVIVAADRMCVGSAEAAQAFLKTLEEPPEGTFFFLLTDQPEQVTLTIRSRCLFLPVKAPARKPSDALCRLGARWMELSPKQPIDRAYRRAQLLTSYWQVMREEIEAEVKRMGRGKDARPGVDGSAGGDGGVIPGGQAGMGARARALLEDEKIEAAWMESKLILARDESLAYLANLFLEKSRSGGEASLGGGGLCVERASPLPGVERAIHAIDELRSALSYNIDLPLAVERCCLKIEGIV